MSIERLLYDHQAVAPQVPARRADEIGRLREEEVTAMRWLRNLPVSRKFTFAFGIVCGLCMVLGGYSLLTFHRIAQMSQNNFPSVLALAQIRNAANNARREDLDLLLCTVAYVRKGRRCLGPANVKPPPRTHITRPLQY
jgi:hypothetical protein